MHNKLIIEINKWNKLLSKGKKHYVSILLTILTSLIISSFFKTYIESLIISILVNKLPSKVLILYKNKCEYNRQKNLFLYFLQELSTLLSASYSYQNAIENISNGLFTNKLIHQKDKIILERITLLIKNQRPIAEINGLLTILFPIREAKNFVDILRHNSLPNSELLNLVRKNEEIIRTALNEEQEIEAENSRQRSETVIMIFLPCLILNFLKYSNPNFFYMAYENTISRLILYVAFFLMLLSIYISSSILLFSDNKTKSRKLSKHTRTYTFNIAKLKTKFYSFQTKLNTELNNFIYHSHRKRRKKTELLEKTYKKALGEISYVNEDENKKKLFIFEILVQFFDNNLLSELSLKKLYRKNTLSQIENNLKICAVLNDEEHMIKNELNLYFKNKDRIFFILLLFSIFLLCIGLSMWKLFLIIAILSPIIQDFELKQKTDIVKDRVRSDFPDAINLILIFLNLNYSFTNSLNNSCTLLQDNIVKTILKSILYRISFGINSSSLIREAFYNYSNSIIDRTCNSLIHYIEDGDKEALDKLNKEATDAYKLISIQRRKSLSSKQAKLLLPMGLSLLSIILICISPLVYTFLNF